MDKGNGMTRRIYGDCIRAELVPLLFYIVSENVGSLLTIYTAGVLGRFADAVFRLDAGAGFDSLWVLVVCLAITTLCMPLLDCVAQMLELSYALAYDRLVLRRFLEKEPRAVEGFTAGEMLQRLDTDPIDLRCGCCRILSNLVLVLVTTVVLLWQALSVSPLFTFVMFAITAIKLTVPMAVRKLERKFDAAERAYGDKMRSVEGEITAEPWRIPLLGIEAPFCNRLNTLFQSYFRETATKSIRCRQWAGGISGFLDTFCTVALLTVGALLASLGQITPGTVAAMFGYFGVCGTIVGRTGEIIREMPKMRNTRERMGFFYGDVETATGKEMTDVDTITAEGLTFRLGETTLLSPISFRIGKGEKMVLTGPNGCGKSTVLRLLTGLWRDYGGHIRLTNGQAREELSHLSPHLWRQQFAYAPQDPMIFAGTVRDNIVPEGGPEVDTLVEALGLTPLLERQIPYGGGGLSGGEKQKISLARALAKDAPVLILDEPGNDLDRETMDWLASYLRETDKTVVYVSHDPSLVEAADCNIVMEKAL